MRLICLLLLAGLISVVVPSVRAAEIVVLTDKPVAEFTLPDGSILKNAFVWKRNSEGLMIVHDDGQFFLNYKTLPDDWRKAYGVGENVAQVESAASKRFDQYTIYPLLERIQGLPKETVVFFESERYKGKSDEVLVSACALQALLDGRTAKAKRLHKIVLDMQPKPETGENSEKEQRAEAESSVFDLDALFLPCDTCGATGKITRKCPVCKGDKKCRKCDGEGMLEPEFEHADPVRCTACRETGKCPKCGGAGTLTFNCSTCKGTGQILQGDKVKAELAPLIKKLIAIQEGKDG